MKCKGCGTEIPIYDQEEPWVYFCPCGEITASGDKMEARYRCSGCGEHFTDTDDLNKHYDMYHNDQYYYTNSTMNINYTYNED